MSATSARWLSPPPPRPLPPRRRRRRGAPRDVDEAAEVGSSFGSAVAVPAGSGSLVSDGATSVSLSDVGRAPDRLATSSCVSRAPAVEAPPAPGARPPPPPPRPRPPRRRRRALLEWGSPVLSEPSPAGMSASAAGSAFRGVLVRAGLSLFAGRMGGAGALAIGFGSGAPRWNAAMRSSTSGVLGAEMSVS